MTTNQYAAAVLLRNANGRTHSVCVLATTGLGPEHAISVCERLALATLPTEGWSVESSWLFDQHVISAEYHDGGRTTVVFPARG